MNRHLFAFALLVIAITLGASAPRTQTRVNVPQAAASRAAAGDTVDVIVGVQAGFVPEGNLAGAAAVADQRAAIAQALDDVMARAAAAGVAVGTRFDFIPFFTASVTKAGLDALAIMPGVSSIEENALDAPSLTQSVPLVNAPAAWAGGATGAGWVVAIADTGVDKAHPFLTGKVVSEACYSGASSGSLSVCPGGALASTALGSGVPCTIDGCEHGTHVAGIATGANAPGGVNGVAPGASLLALQVFSRFDNTTTCGGVANTPCALSATSDQISALNRVFTLVTTAGAHIASVNMSLGGGQYFDQPTCDAANTARKAAIDNLRSVGVATVIASGNNGFTGSMSSPGCISTAVSVGSTTDLAPITVSSFSNEAPFLSLLAPGSNITSSVPGGGYDTLNGTSMATPHVAGAWAILKQASPTASVTAVLAALTSTGTGIADNRGSAGGRVHPLINVNAARLALAGGGGATPGAPFSFLAAADGTTLSMSWRAPVTGAAATGYSLFVRAGGVLLVPPVALGNVTSLVVPNVPNGTFTLSVAATNAAGAGPESNSITVAVPGVPLPPGSPTGLTRSVAGDTVTFSWVAPTSGGPVGSYVLAAGFTPGFTVAAAQVELPPTQTSIAIPGVPPGTFYVRVFARNSGGNSQFSTNEVQVVVAGPAPPGAPTLNPATVSGSTVGLSWAPGAGGAPTAYVLGVSLTPGGTPTPAATLATTSVTVPGVPSGTYYLRVSAVNALGTSPLSNQITVVVP